MGPGFSPEQSLEPDAVTLVNAAGESATYSWKDSTPPKRPGKPQAPCVQIINTKSRFRPFTILRPQDQPTFDVYAGEIRRDVTIFPWWNHWPAASYPSDGRYAVAADRTSHSSLTHLQWNASAKGHHWLRKIMLAGLTEQPAAELLPLMRSWASPAPIKLTSKGFGNGTYDPSQKAYVLERVDAASAEELSLTLDASEEAPVLNPALVVKGWGSAAPQLVLNGRPLTRGTDYRIGHRQTLQSTDLIVWIKAHSTTPLELTLTPK